MKENKNLKEKIGTILGVVAAWSTFVIVGMGIYGISYYTNKMDDLRKQIKNRREAVNVYQKRIFKNFDKNNSGRLEGEEISELAKKCEYNGVMPLEHPLVTIKSIDPVFGEELDYQQYAKVSFSGYGSNIYGPWVHGEPQWRDSVIVSKQRLEDLANHKK